MARSIYTGGTVTDRITVEHTWGSDERTVRVDILVGGHYAAPFSIPADALLEVAQALQGAAAQFQADDARADDLAEPEPAAEATEDYDQATCRALGAHIRATRHTAADCSALAERQAAVVQRIDNGDGTYRYDVDGETFTKRSTVRYTHASLYTVNDVSGTTSTPVLMHKTEAAARKARGYHTWVKTGTVAITEVTR